MVEIDYSVYLVTGRNFLPPGKDYLDSLEESLQGGVTVVQVREKDADTGEFIEIARKSKEVCDKYNVPLIINDRVDVALVVGAAGLHIGQDDMDIAQARKLLPPGTIIGVSCNKIEELEAAVKAGADYVGIGTVWPTQTKDVAHRIIGPRGIGERLKVLDGTGVKAVAIGGIKSTNLWRTLHGGVTTTGSALDGVAVVSEIMGSPEPKSAAEKLSSIVKAFKKEHARVTELRASQRLTKESIIGQVAELVKKIRDVNPLVHQITNHVVATQSANVTLAIGASPIMATEPAEMEDLSKIANALLVNIGTMVSSGVEGARLAGVCANKYRKPIVFDPVGVGASAFRRNNANGFLNQWQASIIKGNAGELAALAGTTEVLSKGVDSVGSGFKDPVSFVRNLARKERCVIVLTGHTDYISDGNTVVSLSNGHPALGQITGSGCILGSCLASYCATALQGKEVDLQGPIVDDTSFVAAIAGTLVLTVAAEIATKKDEFKGPGTFLSVLIDTLSTLKAEDIVENAKLTIH
ncbi:thiamine biosynthetic bifunctional enzyme [Coprinopsis cinerea okayama7|uniref:Thiamine biosynthetic bifunctional enzyme n=1 Tax=Coprinopsis cinerea (strain Okayama-7 / 130 / ATCC MYA-4618 / FGSC 9003) TaxID=240176 RepID=A8N7H4_COPC7|nr:thiamine biosynthetic bifunctional enzyme [Coprinopsis cinerea okayama7\|eukprot:XP_001830780.1 thiamine biosynthetic bifunctional enzyme [Coprinopsis cinerea okayama7\